LKVKLKTSGFRPQKFKIGLSCNLKKYAIPNFSYLLSDFPYKSLNSTTTKLPSEKGLICKRSSILKKHFEELTVVLSGADFAAAARQEDRLRTGRLRTF
jgi:hypothetical protein